MAMSSVAIRPIGGSHGNWGPRVGFHRSSSSRSDQPITCEETPATRPPQVSSSLPDSLATARARQSRLLDRWVAHQATCAAVSSIDRVQSDVKAELSELSATTEPVLSRAKTLIRNNSLKDSSSTPVVINLPRPSPSSPETVKPSKKPAQKPERSCKSQPIPVPTSSSPRDKKSKKEATKAAAHGLPPKVVRASSLIQMWRELEAETVDASGGGASLKRGFSNCSSELSTMSFPASSVDETDAGWESDMSGPSCTSDEGAEQDPSSGIAEDCMLPGKPTVTTYSIVMNRAANFGSSCLHQQINKFEGKGVLSNGQGMGGLGHSGSTKRGIRKADLQQMYEKLLKEKTNELHQLVQRHYVSAFPHRGRIQTFLRYRWLRQEVKSKDHHRPKPIGHEQDKSNHGNRIQHLRKQFTSRENLQDGDFGPIAKFDYDIQTKASAISFKEMDPNLVSLQYKNIDNEKLNQREVIESKKERDNDRHHVNDDSIKSNDIWEDPYQVRSIGWDKPIHVSHPDIMKNNMFAENSMETKQEDEVINNLCHGGSPISMQHERNGEKLQNEFLETYFDNDELRELLERRTVSISLASEFRKKLDQLILSSIERQQQIIDNYECDENGEYNLSTYASRLDYNEHGANYSTALTIPQSNQEYCNLETPSYSLSSDYQHGDSIHELRSDIAHVYYKMDELGKLIENCVKWQEKLEASIKSELLSILHAEVAKADNTNSSRSEHAKKGFCCVCLEGQIDTLLYRCGHMCTCFKCAEVLKQSSSACPVCHVPIQDVVRANLHV